MISGENDPLWRMRHALAGVGLALLGSVFLAAWVGSALGDAWGDSYEARVTVYAGLLFYVLVGAVVLFAKLARHETRPVSAGRVGLWLLSLWLWPVLLAVGRRSTPPTPPGG